MAIEGNNLIKNEKTLNKPTILLLGGSMQQVPVIRKARDLGFRTVVVDYLPDNPGQYECDRWYQESTTDVEEVERIAREEKVSGILAYASDPAALPAAIVATRLGLPTNPVDSVRILGVKHNFRDFLRDNGFAAPQHFSFNASDSVDTVKERMASLKFPVVIKPTDSSGSKGVSFIDNTDQVEEAIRNADQYSRNNILICEEFITRGYPYVIGGDIFVEDGKIVVYGDMECLRDKGGDGLIPMGKKLPDGLNDTQRKNLYRELERLINVLGIRFGQMNIEVLVDADNNIHFLEVGPRAGGNMIPIQLSDGMKIDLLGANVLAAMGLPVNLNPSSPDGGWMTYVLHSDRDGIFVDVAVDPEIAPYIYRQVIYKQPGDKVEFFDGAGKAIGIVFMHFPDVETMNHYEREIGKLIQINITPLTPDEKE